MAEFIEMIRKDTNIQNHISQTINKYNKESFSARPQIGQRALIQSKVFKRAINLIDETISDRDIELEQKDNQIQFLEDRIGTSVFKIREEMNRGELNRISNKKNASIINKYKKHLIIINTLKIKSNKTKKNFKRICYK